MVAKSVVMPWVRVALNILLVVAILSTIAVVAVPFANSTLVALVADFLVPVSFITLIWVRKRMIGEPPTDSMSVQAKVCMVLIAAMIVLPMLEGIVLVTV